MRKIVGTAAAVIWFSVVAGNSLGSFNADAPETGKHAHKPAHRAAQHTGGDVVLRRQDNGHFFADVKVNGTRIGMLADTGASVVALSVEDAEAVGVDTNNLDFDRSVSTANGTAEVATVTLDEVEIGSIRRTNVPAMVARGLSGSLLGMSFFNTLSKVGIESDKMVLED